MTAFSLCLSALAATFLAGAVDYAVDGLHLPSHPSAIKKVVSYADQIYHLNRIKACVKLNMWVYLITLGQTGCRAALNTA